MTCGTLSTVSSSNAIRATMIVALLVEAQCETATHQQCVKVGPLSVHSSARQSAIIEWPTPEDFQVLWCARLQHIHLTAPRM
eukprot:4742721-Amphidinium_carterae.1